MRRRDLRKLSQAPRRARRGAQQGRLARSPAQATMFVWAQIPEAYAALARWNSRSSSYRSQNRRVPGIGFGDYGDGHVRFALIENEERTRQALRGIKQMLAKTVVSGQLTVVRMRFVLSFKAETLDTRHLMVPWAAGTMTSFYRSNVEDFLAQLTNGSLLVWESNMRTEATPASIRTRPSLGNGILASSVSFKTCVVLRFGSTMGPLTRVLNSAKGNAD